MGGRFLLHSFSQFNSSKERERVNLALSGLQLVVSLPFGKAAPILIGLNGAANAGWETEQRGGTADQIVGKMVVSFLLDYGLSAFPIKTFSQALKAVPGGFGNRRE